LASSCPRLAGAAAARGPLAVMVVAAVTGLAAGSARAQRPAAAAPARRPAVAARAASPRLAQVPRQPPATAPLVLAGRVVRVRGLDSVPLAGVRVVEHRVGTDRQGPLDSLASDARGRFSFRVARPDTAAMYVVSTRYAGIGYFSTPFAPGARAGADSIVLPVFDTSSAGAPLDVAVRHVVVSAPDQADGSRDVLDIVQVSNPGTTTRVARAGTPTWRMLLPRGIEAFRVGEGDVPADAVHKVGDSLLVSAPFPPGVKQVVAIYVVPSGMTELRVPIDQPTAQLEVLIEDSLANATGAALASGNPLQFGDRTFRHFASARAVRGETAEITFGGPKRRNLTWLTIALAGLLLAGGAFVAARRRGPAVPAPAPVGPDALVRQIVALDERYAGREHETPAAEWAGYQARRASLKAQVAERLVRR